MTANHNELYRYVHNQLVERHPKVTLHSWGLFFVLQVALLLRRVATLSREIYGYRRRQNRQVDSVKSSVGTILLGFHPQHPRITNFEEKGSSPIVDNVR